MIWFACKACGKRDQRPEAAAGTLVFCACGQGNRVPWESTVPAPEQPEQAPAAREEPRARPERDFDEDAGRAPYRRRRREPRRRDPDHCFNHPEVHATQTCAACGEVFCDGCVVTLQEHTLCGPCKNFQLRTAQRSASPSALGIISLVVGLLSNPVAFCPSIVAQGLEPGASVGGVMTALIGLCAPLVALLLGFKALHDIETKPRVGGRAIAMTGLVSGTVSLLWCLTLLLIMAVRSVEGD